MTDVTSQEFDVTCTTMKTRHVYEIDVSAETHSKEVKMWTVDRDFDDVSTVHTRLTCRGVSLLPMPPRPGGGRTLFQCWSGAVHSNTQDRLNRIIGQISENYDNEDAQVFLGLRAPDDAHDEHSGLMQGSNE